MRPKRLFAAIDFQPAITEQLVELDPELPGVHWLPPEKMHLTLGFFGEVEPEREEILCEKLETIRFKKFFLPVNRVGCFPGKGHPRVVWAGVGEGHPQLFHLHKRVQEAALGAGLQPELRSWHPHITMARCRNVSAEMVRPFLKANAEFDAGLARVENFSLHSSVLGGGGSAYTRELEIAGL